MSNTRTCLYISFVWSIWISVIFTILCFRVKMHPPGERRIAEISLPLFSGSGLYKNLSISRPKSIFCLLDPFSITVHQSLIHLFSKLASPLVRERVWAPLLDAARIALGWGVGLKYLPLCYCRSELLKTSLFGPFTLSTGFFAISPL